MTANRQVIVERLIGGLREGDTEDAYEVVETRNTLYVGVGDNLNTATIREIMREQGMDVIIKRNRASL